jgi:hypothetical protein
MGISDFSSAAQWAPLAAQAVKGAGAADDESGAGRQQAVVAPKPPAVRTRFLVAPLMTNDG